MDATQLIIIISISLITLVIVACGVWMVLILQELRTTIKKTNAILDDTKQVTATVAQPFSSLSDFIVGFKNGVDLFNSFFKKKKRRLDDED
jgi:zinc transporter ZupT